MTKRLIKIIKDEMTSLEYIEFPDNSNVSIDLTDTDGNQIFVGDILYDSNSDTYFTVFEVPGGFAIESNPKSFGLYDLNDPFPCYESTADRQTASYIQGNCVVAGNIDSHKLLYDKIKSMYEKNIITLRNR